MRRAGTGAAAMGAVLLVGAVVGFIVVPEHAPGSVVVARQGPTGPLTCAGNGVTVPADCVQHATGLSHTAYDTLKIATWALAIVGALLVAMGLIRSARPGVER